MTCKMNIHSKAISNRYYRRVMCTTQESQLVLMNLLPLQDIGAEVHTNSTQTIVVISGTGIAIVKTKKYSLKKGDTLVIPSGYKHNVKAGKRGMKIYTVYSFGKGEYPEHDPHTKQMYK